jgi:aryl-alcohol dehydrogenase-like predicted oxidoreductase
VQHLQSGECIEAMEVLKSHGKVRYWGISLNTYDPFPEAEYVIEHKMGSGIQIVFNLINQRALQLLEKAGRHNYGIIARMPFQFGLLTEKFDVVTRFDTNDHRNFRLKPAVLQKVLQELEEVWLLSDKWGLSPTQLSLSFVLSFPEISCVIPGIKTPEQAIANTSGLKKLGNEQIQILTNLYQDKFDQLLEFMAGHET